MELVGGRGDTSRWTVEKGRKLFSARYLRDLVNGVHVLPFFSLLRRMNDLP